MLERSRLLFYSNAKTMLKNITEIITEQKLDDLWKSKTDCCKCDKCREDILSYALNKLPPQYVCTDEGELYVKTKTLSKEYDFDILRALAQAMAVVEANPRH